MIGRKYDWVMLKEEFMAGPWLTVKEFMEHKDIPWNYHKKNTKGWSAEKSELTVDQRELAIVTRKERSKSLAKKILELERRQAYLSRFLQQKAIQKIKATDAEDLTVEEARKLLSLGMETERKVLRYDDIPDGDDGGKGKGNTYNQINFNQLGTNFDKIIKEGSYEEIIELIAELKRSGTGIPNITSDGSSSVKAGGKS